MEAYEYCVCICEYNAMSRRANWTCFLYLREQLISPHFLDSPFLDFLTVYAVHRSLLCHCSSQSSRQMLDSMKHVCLFKNNYAYDYYQCPVCRCATVLRKCKCMRDYVKSVC